MPPTYRLGLNLLSVGAPDRPITNPGLAYGESYQPQKPTQPVSLSRFIGSLLPHAAGLDEDTVEYWREQSRLRSEVIQKNAIHLKAMEEKCRELEIGFDTDLSNIQRTVFQQVAETYSSKTDDDLQTEIKKLRNGITSWAKKSARKSLDHLSSEDLALFNNHLRGTISPERGEDVFGELIHKQKFLSLLLGALLSHALHWEIIRNPFFFAKQPRKSSDNVGTNPGVFLDPGYIDMYAHMIEINEVEAHRWRSERVREFLNEEQKKTREAAGPKPETPEELSPNYDVGDSTALTTIHSPQQGAEEIPTTLSRAPTLAATCQADGSCRQARELFVAGLAGKLIDQTKEDFQNQLDQLFMSARNLSLNIWARKSNIICSFAKELENELYVDDSKRIGAHELFLPDNHSLLQDKLFSILVHPLIEVYGTEEGQGYSIGRVLMPAVAWYLPS